MVRLINFEEALRETEGADRTLVVGNGFSAQYFNYASLFAASGLRSGTPVSNLFKIMKTVDFEAIVRALEGAIAVEIAYGHHDHADQLQEHAQAVREGLIRAVHRTHPTHRRELSRSYDTSADFLTLFQKVFTLNYDLILYWVNLQNRVLRDGFGLGAYEGTFIGPFSHDAACTLYNLHGGLHLFDNGAGEMMKALDAGAGVISTISRTIRATRRFPVYVAEGTSAQKMSKINSVSYLRHCYDALCQNSAVVFVYGHSADENDAHIYRAIFTSEARHMFFGVYEPDRIKLQMLDGVLSKYQKTAGSPAGYTFFDSSSARVWDI